MALTYEKGLNRPVRVFTPDMDPTGGNLAGTCGGTNIGASTGVIGSGLIGDDVTSASVVSRELPLSTIGDADFPGVKWVVFNINNIEDAYSGLSWCFFSQAVTDVVNGADYPSVVGYLPNPKNAAFTTAYAGDKGFAPIIL
jgi:hypothetical protein